jgi:hypothetical protein
MGISNPYSGSLSSGENYIGTVGGTLLQVFSSTLTRPNDTTAYVSKDSISNSTSSPILNTISSIARITGGGGYITKIRANTNQSACTTRLKLHIYFDSSSISAIADNSPFTVLDTNFAKRVGSIDLPAFSTSGSGSDSAETISADLRVGFKCLSGSRNLYFAVETTDAFTPNALQTFKFEFMAECY